MRRLSLTLSTPAENIALDEALLEQSRLAADIEGWHGETLRLWQSPTPIVVVGRSSRVEQEVNLAECQRRGVPVLRRPSGGAAIVAGPGCLMYTVVLNLARRPQLTAVDAAHAFVLGRVLKAVNSVAQGAARAGTSDLVLQTAEGETPPRKFSGNSMRLKRDRLLYHGTLLYDFDLSLVSALLGVAPRQPDYRQQRPHGQFVANLPCQQGQLEQALMHVWQAEQAPSQVSGQVSGLVSGGYPRDLVDRLVAERYKTDAWNFAR